MATHGTTVRSAALVVTVLALAACSRSPEAAAPPRPSAVTVVAVAQGAVPVSGQYVGQTEAVKTVEVRARVEGYDGGEDGPVPAFYVAVERVAEWRKRGAPPARSPAG